MLDNRTHMRQSVIVLSLLLAALAAVTVSPEAARQMPARPSRALSTPAPALKATLDRYCATCHNGRVSTAATAGGVVLDAIDLTQVASDPALWERVIRKLRTGAMPPDGSPKPEKAAHDALVSWLEGELDRASARSPRPGRPAIHRLNRAEYANAIRDLLELTVDPSGLLPPDESGGGFDNNADMLGVSPALLERYVSAAARISALAVGSPAITPSSMTYRVRGDASQTAHQDGLPLGTRGGVLGLHTFPLDGEYVIKVKLLETNLGSIRGLESRNDLEIAVDGRRVLLAPVGGAEDYVESSRNATNVVNALDARLQVRVRVDAGQRPVTAAFLQKAASLGPTRLQPFRRSTVIATDHIGLPHVEHMTVSGPFNPGGAEGTPSRRRIFVCRPATAADEAPCARRILSTLARRAYRRPVDEGDIAPLFRFYETGRRTGFDAGIELALRAMLASPKFLLRIEQDPAGVAPGGSYPLDDLALASRLSFFLWSSIPDDELLDVAARGRLRDAAVRRQQVRRMLADPKAGALTTNFAGQWLHLRNIRSTTPDKNDFPDFDDNLRRSLERELELFFDTFIREDRPLLELLTASDTFLDERLAGHYGIPHIYGSHFRRVTDLPDVRRGLLGKGGILLVTSHADRTSPVVRGKWILDNLLGSPPPPAPPDVPGLPEPKGDAPTTVRARMEQHRANPVCASCHKVMDPLGLALEHFDAVGAFRTADAGQPIDASARFFDGTPIDGVGSLRSALLARPEVFVGTMTEKLLAYAIGRGIEPHDMPAVRTIVRRAARQDYRFGTLVEGIVESAPFLMRQADTARETQTASR
jgi:hypothetical protein